jgi:hypothetical protein
MKNLDDNKKIHKLKVREDILLHENLFNFKRWFNGLKKFSAVKVNPPPQK